MYEPYFDTVIQLEQIITTLMDMPMNFGKLPPFDQKYLTEEKRQQSEDLKVRATLAEIKLKEALAKPYYKLPPFYFQEPCYGYIPDFLEKTTMLDVELDGSSHCNKGETDEERDLNLLRRGVTVVRFSNDMVIRNLREVVASILSIYLYLKHFKVLPGDGNSDRLNYAPPQFTPEFGFN